MLKQLNVGSGQRKFGQGWTNIDINPRWTPDVVADGASMPMFADGSADLVVLHHSLEHLPLEHSKAAIKEASRILCPGGSLLIFVPNLRALVDGWIKGRISDYIFCVNIHGAYMGDDADVHRWSFTKESLKEHINRSAPWCSVLPFDWRIIPQAEIARDWWILAVEAIK